MTLVDVAGAQVWVEEHGTGHEVVLASAAGFAAGYPAGLALARPHCRVITVQARGFGRSTHLEEPPAAGWLDQWADDVVAVADHLGVDRFVYTGVSHGAGIGWHLVRRAPRRVRALVSVVGTPHDRNGDTSSSAGRRAVVSNRRDPRVVEEQLRILGGRPDPDRVAQRDATVAALVRKVVGQTDEEGRINQGMPYPEATTDEQVAKVLAAVQVPVLLLAGLRDGVISPGSTLRAAVSVPRCKAVLFEDEGHFVDHERPERLVREVCLFLDELASAPPSADRVEALGTDDGQQPQ